MYRSHTYHACIPSYGILAFWRKSEIDERNEGREEELMRSKIWVQ